ncbi:MAG: DEAD/DEAH box helicase family protein [Treponema sp.]|jgi:type III restriction enzyme|nr:DEAD/DEAH box helicase family protein [Treponema sp.]
MAKKIDRLIINSPYDEPAEYWDYDSALQSWVRKPGRRPAGYTVATPGSDSFNDSGMFIQIPRINQIRDRVKAWRQNNYPGITGTTRKLITHWNNRKTRDYPFFFCQLDAIETLIWLTEAPEADKTGIDIKGDGGAFKRLCTKLCTGGGKTTVMAMLIAWQICNKVSYPQDKSFSKNIFIVAPGLTVKNRLKVLETAGSESYYHKFNIIPPELQDKLNQGKVFIRNWQALSWDSAEVLAKKKSVDKRPPKSDEAFSRSVLGPLAKSKDILVINDEAHHAWRLNSAEPVKRSREEKEAVKEATLWISGLDRIHAARTILACYDFSATPFIPSGKKNDGETLFSWIVSDFGLTDGIESGLVKTPRVVIRDDSNQVTDELRSKLYHLYADPDIKAELSKPSEETAALPPLVETAYHILGTDYLETFKAWRSINPQTKLPYSPVPPVMISVANRTETAARIKSAFERGDIAIKELCEKQYMLHIDSKVLEKAEEKQLDLSGAIIEEGEGETRLTKDKQAELLRQKVDTVGQIGESGEQIRNVISVSMLTEGWDAKTVTHILGLRAFSSQLLCEQVVGRGLRRTSYELKEGSKLFEPEYVNIFGIPFTFLPHEEDESSKTPPKNPTRIYVLPDKGKYALFWPNIIQIKADKKPRLDLDFKKIPVLTIDAANTPFRADLFPILEGKPNLDIRKTIDLIKNHQTLRFQQLWFNAVGRLYNEIEADWKKETTPYALLGRLFSFVETYLSSGRIVIEPALFIDPLEIRILKLLNLNVIVRHVWQYIEFASTLRYTPVFDPVKKVRSTGDMQTWHTLKHCFPTKKSHISHCVWDSKMEGQESIKLEHNPHVAAYAKNDHLGFGVSYTHNGIPHTYYPDFLIKLDNRAILVLETKGQDNRQAQAKKKALEQWIETVNSLKEYGQWYSAVSYNAAEIDGIIQTFL